MDAANLAEPVANMISDLLLSTWIQIINTALTVWMDKNVQFTNQQYWAGNSFRRQYIVQDPDYIPDSTVWDNNAELAQQVWYMIPRFRTICVNETILQRILTWMKVLAPNVDWALIDAPVAIPVTEADRGPMDIEIAVPDTAPAGDFTMVAYQNTQYPIRAPVNSLEFWLNDTVKRGEAPQDGSGNCTFVWRNVFL
jgi:hypothetical protein